MTVGTFESNMQGEDLRIGIVQARFNETVGNACCRRAWLSSSAWAWPMKTSCT